MWVLPFHVFTLWCPIPTCPALDCPPGGLVLVPECQPWPIARVGARRCAAIRWHGTGGAAPPPPSSCLAALDGYACLRLTTWLCVLPPLQVFDDTTQRLEGLRLPQRTFAYSLHCGSHTEAPTLRVNIHRKELPVCDVQGVKRVASESCLLPHSPLHWVCRCPSLSAMHPSPSRFA